MFNRIPTPIINIPDLSSLNISLTINNKELFDLLNISYFEDKLTKIKYPIYSEQLNINSPFQINKYYNMYIIINSQKHYITYKDIASKNSKYNLFKLVIKPLNHLTYNTILRRVYKNKRCISKLKQDLKHIKNKENKILEFKL